MVKFHDSEKTNKELDEEIAGCVPGDYAAVVHSVETRELTSKRSGNPYDAVWLTWVIVGGDYDGAKVRQFLSFDHPDDLHAMVLKKRRETLTALGVESGSDFDPEVLIDRGANITVLLGKEFQGERRPEVAVARPGTVAPPDKKVHTSIPF